ncbi:MAG TPA: hypothetical protein P5332_11765 [Ignavibacteriales bacterium]|nr:hypothetical protein [Ignavibacteriales bacterium]
MICCNKCCSTSCKRVKLLFFDIISNHTGYGKLTYCSLIDTYDYDEELQLIDIVRNKDYDLENDL